jgi:hypothetical protein
MVWYNYGKYYLLKQDDATSSIDVLTDTIKVALMKTSYSINIDTHDFYNDVSGSEIVATSYVAGTLASKGVACDTTNDRAEFDALDLAFTNIGGAANDTFDQIVIFKDTGTPATSTLIAHATVTSTTTDGGTITLVWNAEGILHIT